MSTSEELLNNFMHGKNKEYLGEKTENLEKDDDNFLNDNQKTMNTFDGRSAVDNEDKGSAILKRIITSVVTIIVLLCAMISAFYILLKIIPTLFAFVKGIMLGFFV